MQLSEAIDGWLAAHTAGLSRSTRRDILDIGASADRCGYAWMDCVDVRDRHMSEIVAEADAQSSLNAGAIRQFLEIAVEWGLTQDAPPLVNDLLPSDTDGWLDAKTSPVVNDLELDDLSWADELPPMDDLDVDNDGELDPLDDDQFFDVDDIEDVIEVAPDDVEPEENAFAVEEDAVEEEAVEEDAVAVEEEAVQEEAVDEDDFDDDELAAIDDDLATTDEDDLDPDELDDIDGDLEALIDDLDADDPDSSDDDEHDGDDLFAADDLFDDGDDDADVVPINTGGESPFSTAAAAGRPADPAASSFLRTLEETGQTPAVFGGLAGQRHADAEIVSLDPISAEVPSIDTAQSGIFSEAAQYDGERSIDWITVAYFAVAAICFAFVIYLALSN